MAQELQKFVLVKLGLAVGQVKRFQVNHAQNCVHVKCSELKVAQDTVAMHNGKHVMEINKTKVTVRLVMEDGGVEVKIHDLSENVTNDDIVAFLRHFGDGLSIREVSWGEGFPLRGMSSGIRVAKMILRRHIKSFATILGESTLISYRGQPMTCRHCTLTQHIGMSCVENKKLLGQKADLSTRLKSASGSTSTSYASVLNSVAPDTNTLLPEFSGTILGPVIPQRPIRPESTGTAPNAPQSGAATSATGHSADGSLNISGDARQRSQLDRVATAIEGGALIDRPNESELASTSVMLLIPLPPAAPAAEGDNKETEEMETESPSAADDAAELNTPHPKLPCEEDDAEMPAVSDLASCESVSPFEFPAPIPVPIPHPDLKKTHSLSSISGTESDESTRYSEFTAVKKKRRPGRPKKSKV
ncbi:hypothetical protein quinque_008811 [Culex quinquefasciatus]